ncbi:MAG: N-acetyl-gamma-glutamyl-phosphate reductase [marine bacterium B5-7]|nr:MAG: N-acetyl-gamma-glutamyl-phosphate reductase [marine bacterium B5-7]
MASVGIVGGTGYTGAELIRLLVHHPDAKPVVITSRNVTGTPVSELFPSLRGFSDLKFEDPATVNLGTCDVVFCATPNGVAMTLVGKLLDKGIKVIDLSADFRISDQALWERWYGMKHAAPELLASAVYGLPEIERERVKSARLVANPGCYPTAVQLGFLPLIEAGVVEGGLIADAKSGVSGAGRTEKIAFNLCEAGDSFKAYGASGHRHLPEICQGLERIAGHPVELTFIPHLVPMIRGIHATLYARVPDRSVDIQALFESRFANEPFVDVMPAGSHPDTRSVRGANTVRISWHRPGDGDMVVILSVEDNLVKGAAGQAIQNMNLMCGFDEAAGLQGPGLVP